MKSIASALLVILCFFMIKNTYAHFQNKVDCTNAKNTADTMQCLIKHREKEEETMADLFQKVETLKPAFLKDIHDNQTIWLDYKKQTCALSSQGYVGESLQQIQKINCDLFMTSQRNHYLNNVLNSLDTSYIPEYSNPPRWINVLVKDYPTIFWGFGEAQSTDTDCDGQNEVIIRGLDETQNMRIAVADSTKTGKPKITILNFDDASSCHILPNLSILNVPAVKPDSGTSLGCHQKIKLHTKTCGDLNLNFDQLHQSYTLKKINNNKDQ